MCDASGLVLVTDVLIDAIAAAMATNERVRR